MKVGIIQESHTANIDANIAKLTSKIEALAKKGAQLIVLSELHNSLYFCQVEDVDNFDLAESIPGKSTDHFSAVAKRLGLWHVSQKGRSRSLRLDVLPLLKNGR